MNLRIAGARSLMLVCILTGVAWADDYDNRAKLMGTWELQAESASAKGAAWVVEDKSDAKHASIHLTQSLGQQKVSEFECELGQECKVQDSGKSATVTVYFNGARLVELETRGKETFKRRFTLAEKADTLEVEVIPIVPEGATEKLVFKRAAK